MVPVMTGADGGDIATLTRSPLFESTNSPRYERQKLIRAYQSSYNCRLVVFISHIFPDCITPFEETLYDADSDKDLHLLLGTRGGDPETALRIIRQTQSRCKKLTVIVPDQAKSAGTLLTIGADHILMGPTSDLGPIDPLIWLDSQQQWIAARAIIAAVKKAEDRIQENPELYSLYASLFEGISVVHLTLAQNAVGRTGDQLKEALTSALGRDDETIEMLTNRLQGPLIDDPQSHGTTISAATATSLGLPVITLASSNPQWQAIWRLWTRYVEMSAPNSIYQGIQIYEGQTASYINRT